MYLPHNHIPPRSLRGCESKVKEKKVQIPSIKKDGNFFFFMMITRGVKTRPSVFLSGLFMLFFFPPFSYFLFLVAICLVFFSGLMEKETPGQVMNQQSGRVPMSGSKEIDETRFAFFCYFARVLFIFSLFFFCMHIQYTYLCWAQSPRAFSLLFFLPFFY